MRSASIRDVNFNLGGDDGGGRDGGENGGSDGGSSIRHACSRARDHSRPWPHFFSSAAGEPADRLLLVRAWLEASKSSAGWNSHDRQDKSGTLGQDHTEMTSSHEKGSTWKSEAYKLYNAYFLFLIFQDDSQRHVFLCWTAPTRVNHLYVLSQKLFKF